MRGSPRYGKHRRKDVETRHLPLHTHVFGGDPRHEACPQATSKTRSPAFGATDATRSTAPWTEEKWDRAPLVL